MQGGVDVVPQLLQRELWGGVERMFQLGEQGLVILRELSADGQMIACTHD